MHNKAPWHARLARTLAVILPIFLASAALGTKFGLWSWQLGLLTLFALGGLILTVLTTLVAIVSIILVLRKGNRLGLYSSIFGLVVPLAIAAMLAPTIMGAGDHPIHDMATDTANPPALSSKVKAQRDATGANPINAYDVPLGQTEQFAEAEGALAQQTYADIIAANYPELAPLEIGETETDAAVNAIQLAMADMGFTGIRYNENAGTVEGLAETFWFGFKDDVVARIADGRIDFRSVSRVGQSDLGANAKRIVELRGRVANKLGLNLQK